ncbi:hypothetical protein [Clostridium sp. YIM B02555]|uniref:hypothetical protein n=1 Tax=Clostridium sp. YIM B02555 TaxID=2911968 RepID=UPI001EEEEB5D|nr:hypothetical protein [Clostridium sp. YIM B02555]
MSIETLKKYLNISEGKLILNENTLPDNLLKDFFEFFNNDPIVIEKAEEIKSDIAEVIKGNIFFLDTLIPVELTLSENSSKKLSCTLELIPESQSILSLNKIINHIFPNMNEIPELYASTLKFYKDTESDFILNAKMNDKTVWTIELGSAPLVISNIKLKLIKTSKGFEGQLDGEIQLDEDLVLNLSYKLPGDFILQLEYPRVNFLKLFESIYGNTLKWNYSSKLMLPPSEAIIKFINGKPSFNSIANIEGLGVIIFSIFYKEKWHYSLIFDINLSNLSKIPGLETLESLESIVNVNKMSMCILSDEVQLESLSKEAHEIADFFEYKDFNFPIAKQVLDEGLSILIPSAIIKNEALNLLVNYFNVIKSTENIFTVAVSLPDPTADSKLFIPFFTEIQAGTTIEGELGALFRSNNIDVFLEAKVNTIIQSQLIQVNVIASVFPTGVLISGTFNGSINFNPLPIKLNNLSLIIGLNNIGIPSFGFYGNINIENLDSSIALFFNSTDPSQSMIAGSINSLTLNDLVKLFTGEFLPMPMGEILGSIGLSGINAFEMPISASEMLRSRNYEGISSAFWEYGKLDFPKANNEVLLVEVDKDSRWTLTNLVTMTHYSLLLKSNHINVEVQPQIYCAPQDTFIGSLKFPQGFHMEGKINHLFFKAQLRIVAEINKGISAKTEIDPITIFKPDFFSITGKDNSGPKLSFSTFSQPLETESMLQEPHFLLNGNIHLLGVDILNTYIYIKSNSISFNASVSPFIEKIELECSLDNSSNFIGNGNFTIGINRHLDAGSLGKTDVKVLVNLALHMTFQNGTSQVLCDGTFDFFGIHCTIPSIDLTANEKALLNISDVLWESMNNIIMMLLKHADYWLSMLKEGILKEVELLPEHIGSILAEVHQLSPNDILNKTKNILGYGTDDMTRALKGAGINANDIIKELQAINISIEDINSVIKNVFSDVHVDITVSHIDIPSGPHVDVPENHLDTPEKRIDRRDHLDTPRQHTDTRRLGFHTDITVVPHTNVTNYTDMVVTPRVNITTPHKDEVIPPHTDNKVHVDSKS